MDQLGAGRRNRIGRLKKTIFLKRRKSTVHCLMCSARSNNLVDQTNILRPLAYVLFLTLVFSLHSHEPLLFASRCHVCSSPGTVDSVGGEKWARFPKPRMLVALSTHRQTDRSIASPAVPDGKIVSSQIGVKK